MPERPSESLRIKLLALALLGGVAYATPAAAHKVVVFATAQAKTIEGEAYFRGGTPVREAKVTVVGPDEQVLGEARTDEEGRFTFGVQVRCDHKLIVDVGEGHAAEYTVPADELPDDLPLPGGATNPPGEPPDEAEPVAPPEHVEKAAAAAPAEDRGAARQKEDLDAEIAAVGRQIAALRRDLDKYKSELRMQDILGGIGYILGVMGLVYYFLGVRRKEKRRSQGE